MEFTPLMIILVLSIIQSVFGVGLLLFGTPLLLVMGYDYYQCLSILLPASIIISLYQIYDYKKINLDGGYRKKFFLYCVPFLVIGMLIGNNLPRFINLKYLLCTTLLLSLFMRLKYTAQAKIQTFLKKYLSFALATMGLIHGLTNMGGSLLTPLVSKLYQDKTKILTGISFDYFFMALSQLLILLAMGKLSLSVYLLVNPILAVMVRFIVGKKIHAMTSEKSYQYLINALILINFFLLLLKK
jgi:uncharacterized membrane protein YfcA